MTVRYLGLLASLAALTLVSGCSMLDEVTSLFDSGGHMSKLKGERISVLSLDSALRPDPALRDVRVVLPPPYRNPEWPEPGGYASNAMYHLEAAGPLKQIWEQDAGKGSDKESRLTASPVVADGRIFVLDAGAHVFAFNVKDGSPLWDRELAPKNGTNSFTMFGLLGTPNTIDPAKGFGGGVAYDDGKLFVTSGFGSVIGLDAKTGRQLWKTDLDIPIINAPVANGGRLFVSTDDNHFYALAEVDGRRLWDHQGIAESAGILESTSAAVAGEFVVAPYTSGEVFALRVQNGQVAWSDILSHSGQVTALSELDDIAGRPVMDRGMVYAISHSGVMAAINLATGDRVWTRDIGGIQTPWAAGDYVYVLTSQARLLCLTRKDGRVRWIHQLQNYRDMEDKRDPIEWAGPILVSDKLIVVSSSGVAESISPYTGELIGRIDIPSAAFIAPIVANGTLYIYTNDAQLVALR